MIERRDFTGRMNADDAEEFIPKNDYLQGMNVRVGRDADGRGGAVKPFKGTQQRTNDPLVGVEETMGSITDEVKGRVYYFKHNSNNNHRIWAWDRKTNQAFIVLQESNVTGGLDFSLDYPVTGLALIGDYLYWTDNLNQPRRVNVERGIKTNNPSYVSQDGTTPDPYTLPLQQWDITVARRVPRYALNTRKLSSALEAGIDDRQVNMIKDLSFQFAYRYAYLDDSYSTVGPFSIISPQNITDYAYVSGPNIPVDYDTIKVALPHEEPIDAEVRLLEVMVRNGNTGPFYIVKTFDRRVDEALFTAHNTYGGEPLSFYFYNDVDGIPVADAEAYLSFFDVPINSQALEIADNRLFLGNNVKGYEYVSTDFTTEARNIGASDPSLYTPVGSYHLIEWQCGTGLQEVVVLRVRDSYGPMAGWYETPFTSADFNSSSLPLTPANTFTRYGTIDPEDIPTNLIAVLNPTCQTWTITDYNPTDNVILQYSQAWGQFIDNARAFREGYTYKVQVVFYDFAGRNAGISHNVQEITTPGPKFDQDLFVNGIQWDLVQDPGNIPLWAHSYAIARSTVTEPFVAGYATEVRYAAKQEDGTYNLTTLWAGSADAVAVNFNPMLEVGIGYVPTIGDVMLIHGENGERAFLEVLSTQGNYVIVEPIFLGNDLAGENFYFEIKTPTSKKDDYFEIGRNYKILNAEQPTRSFSVVSGQIHGDTYFGKRTVVNTFIPVQCMNPSNKYWQEWPQDIGRIEAFVYSKQRRYETEVAWGATYFPGTETNNLNQFLSADIKTIDSALGAIQKLVFTSRTQEYGTVMLAIGQSDVASMYLGRTEFYNTDETPSVLRTVDVVGNINILKGGFGTVNPESVVENDGDVYWFSAIKSAFVRYSKAGVEPISDRKMASFAQWLGNAILTTAADAPGVVPIRLPAGFDDFNKEYVCSIPPIGTWPINYRVMDVETNVNMTEAPVGSVTAALQAGEIYRFTFTAAGPVTVNITCNDLFFGTKTFTTVGTSASFLFVSALTSTYTFIVTTTPSLPSVAHSYSLKKLHVDPYEVVNLFPKTIVWSEESNGWSTFFNALPEWWGRIGDKLLSFRGGNLFTHDSSTPSSFYGIQYPSWIATIFNQPPNETKLLQVFSCEAEGAGGNDVNGAPDYVHFRTEQPYAQSSDIIKSEFSVKEGVPHVGVRRDRLSPNTAGTAVDKLLKGDEMRGRYAKVLMEYAKSRNFVLRLVNLVTQKSHGHKT